MTEHDDRNCSDDLSNHDEAPDRCSHGSCRPANERHDRGDNPRDERENEETDSHRETKSPQLVGSVARHGIERLSCHQTGARHSCD